MTAVENTYNKLYNSLSQLREHLHLSGRIDDSNAKLDELSKILAICIADNKNLIKSNKIVNLIEDKKVNIVSELQKMYIECIKLKEFRNSDDSSIFGVNSTLNLQESENEFARLLVDTVYNTFNESLLHSTSNNSFDLVNEAFGHFVRDNFRGNIEDAQYMTPPEVVDFICEWALNEVLKSDVLDLNNEFVVMDPSCGVGSFLAAFYKKTPKELKKNIQLIGLDKVDRMVRLSKINMMLFNTEKQIIQQGNSLINNEFLNSFNNKVDLILTNPPFGANIPSNMITNEPKINYPLFNDIESISNSIDSELAFIDRELALLKNGGKLFVVVPDSTISSRGLSETLRERLKRKAILKGVIELPAVTFAQAGTRTKTSILYIEKNEQIDHNGLVTMANIHSLGFQVSVRKGVSVKKYEGINELEVLKNKLLNSESKKGIISSHPSCVKELISNVINNSWTASHYNSRRINAIQKLSENSNYLLKSLDEIVNFETPSRRRLKQDINSKCISILHIIGDGLINFNDFMSYNPKTKGNVCFPGDVLISKINPRIIRILVVPELDLPMTCSNEFEIVTMKEGFDPYWLTYILQEPLVQDQIQNLTSGTSSSHNRIKTNELKLVMIPIIKDKKLENKLNVWIQNYKNSIQSINENSLKIFTQRKNDLLNNL